MRATRAFCSSGQSSFSRFLGQGQSRSAEAKAFCGTLEKGAVTFTSDFFCSFSLPVPALLCNQRRRGLRA